MVPTQRYITIVKLVEKDPPGEEKSCSGDGRKQELLSSCVPVLRRMRARIGMASPNLEREALVVVDPSSDTG